eukprot:m.231612 g.231612  ORF g.231612 m.231612 type:complete len:505 (+) comp17367_c0_seq1:206-1720(+)
MMAEEESPEPKIELGDSYQEADDVSEPSFDEITEDDINASLTDGLYATDLPYVGGASVDDSHAAPLDGQTQVPTGNEPMDDQAEAADTVDAATPDQLSSQPSNDGVLSNDNEDQPQTSIETDPIQQLLNASAQAELDAPSLGFELDLPDAVSTTPPMETEPAMEASPVDREQAMVVEPSPPLVANPEASPEPMVEVALTSPDHQQDPNITRPTATSNTTSPTLAGSDSTDIPPVASDSWAAQSEVQGFSDVTIRKPDAQRAEEHKAASRVNTANFFARTSLRLRSMMDSSAKLEDVEVQATLEQATKLKQDSHKLNSLLSTYTQKLTNLHKAETAMSQFLLSEGVRTPGPIGECMQALGRNQRAHCRAVEDEVDARLNEMAAHVTMFEKRIVGDVITACSKTQKAYVKLHAAQQVAAKPTQKELQRTAAQEKLAEATEQFQQLKSDVNTKYLLVEDHRRQTFNSMFEEFQLAWTQVVATSSAKLQEAEAKSKASYTDAAQDAVL